VRPVLIGIAPARAGDEGQPLSCIAPQSTGRKIQDMAGLKRLEYLNGFDRVNVCPFPQPSTIKPKEWHQAAENLAGSILRGRRVVLLGPNVAECFGIKRTVYEYCTWHKNRGGVSGAIGWRVGSALPFSWAVLPHPSGRNRWYNEQENVDRASKFLKELIIDCSTEETG